MLLNRKTIKISLVLPTELLRKIDEAAKSAYATRADYIRQAMVNANKPIELPSVPELPEPEPPVAKIKPISEINGIPIDPELGTFLATYEQSDI